MTISKAINYQDNNITLNGYCAYPDGLSKKTPAVMVCHDWTGRNEFACHKANDLTKLGYIGFAIDMYGDSKLGQTKEEKSALIQPFIQDRNKLQRRILSALEALHKVEWVDSKRIAAIGFCFGGLCVLDLARSGADIAGVVSFHGLLHAPEEARLSSIKAKILALHGYDDPMVTPENVMAFGNEMTHANADWQLHMYGSTMHAFTNPEANDPGFGTVYNKTSDSRAWIAMKNFFTEIF
ncbi:MAG: carboxymethylenebutenolidase [Gammaproteobacteria bacterium RIFCSPHIGHO2_12_FULL_37_14]|nr:MAG: carboxymethylenebutenolidase [Gammaproteobacteria bacterium RIFCSPHIGHO2_12_FULL_37_14]